MHFENGNWCKAGGGGAMAGERCAEESVCFD